MNTAARGVLRTNDRSIQRLKLTKRSKCMTFRACHDGAAKSKKPAQGGYILSGPLCDFKERFLPETPGTDFLCGGSSVLLSQTKQPFRHQVNPFSIIASKFFDKFSAFLHESHTWADIPTVM
jgi:hypothetical protein